MKDYNYFEQNKENINYIEKCPYNKIYADTDFV